MANYKNNKQKTKVIIKKKGGFLGKLVAFLLGVIFGSVGLLGGISAIVLYVLNKPIKDAYNTVEQAGVNIPGELTDYLSEDFATLTLMQAFGAIGTTVGGIANGANSFGDLVSISPYLSEQIANLSNTLAGFGVPATKDELLSLNFANIPDYLTKKVNSISLAHLMSTFGGGISADNGVLCSLLYGTKDVHYTVTTDNKIELLPLTYTFVTEDGNNYFTDWDNNVYERAQNTETGAVGWVSTKNTEFYIAQFDSTSANGQISYAYEIRNFNDKTLYKLARESEGSSRYLVYANDTLQKHTGLTIGNIIQGEGIMSVVNKMQLFTLLNMNETTDQIVLALAGYEKAEDGTIKLQDGKSPTTIGDLMTGASDIIADMKLADLIPIEDDNSLMMALAYKNGDKTQPRTIADLTENSSELISTIKIADLMEISDDNSLMMSLAYKDGDKTQPRTIADLTENSSDIINGMKLADIMEISDDNSLMMSLAYENGDKSKPRTIKDLTESSSDIINSMKLADLMEISEDNKMMMSLAYENGDMSKPRTIKDLTESSSAIINSMKVADLIEIDESNQLMMSLAYENGDKSKPRTIEDLTKNNNLVNDMELSAALALDMNDADSITPVMRAIAFGKCFKGDGIEADYDYTIVPNPTTGKNEIKMLNGKSPKTIGDLNNSSFIDSLELGEIISINETSPQILKTLQFTTIGGLSDSINNLSLGQIIKIDSSSPQILQALEGATLGDGENSISKKIDTLSLGQIIKIDSSSPQILQALEGATLGNGDDSITNKMNSISLGEVMKIDSNSPKLLQSLSGTKINELGTAVSELKLNDMMDVGDNFILKHLKDSTLSTLPDDISELTIEDVFADDIYDEHGNMKGTWKYLLDNDISTDEEIEKHNLNDMGTLITNMTENFQKATLKDLKADGILPGLSDELLTTNIPFILKPRPNATTYGDLNITELFNLVGKLG